MPNWCEGVLKVRGKPENVKRWCKENIHLYACRFDKAINELVNSIISDAVKIDGDEDEIYIDIQDDSYIE